MNVSFLEKMDVFWYQLGKGIKLSVYIFLILVIVWGLTKIMQTLP